MNYQAVGPNNQIAIADEQFLLLSNSMKLLLEIMYLEEKFDYLLRNYQELETELVSITSENRIFRNFDYHSIAEQRALVSRRIANMLSTGRQYHGQSLRHVSALLGRRSVEYRQIEESRATLGEKNWEYAFVDAFRNYVQHFGIPVHSFEIGTRVVRLKPRKIYHSTGIYIDPDELKLDRDFDKALIDRVPLADGKINVMPLIRIYVECLGGFHLEIRSVLNALQEKAIETIHDSIDDFYKTSTVKERREYFLIRNVAEEGNVVSEQTIFSKPIERLHNFQRKNRQITGLHLRFISSESPQDLKDRPLG